ncbi:terminase small subunit [Pantoea stewartii]|uniref:terminase small subunit n=1 Tax=Pantoea stewartii TaxID=66269 RepID=UPI0016234E46|nr:terminase small subunit [Pantoea stewartii]MBC0852573.1 terminase small subunit [Pantoea stewartii]
MTLNDTQKALFNALTQLQRRFITELLKGSNQTQAYRAAGGKAKGDGARSKAAQIVTNSNVQAFLQAVQYEVVSEAIMTRTEALERLTAIARTGIGDLATFGTHRVGEDDDGHPLEQTVWRFKNSDQLTPEQLAAISELTASKEGLKVKLHDPKSAIKQIAEMQGWEAPKRTEHSGTIQAEISNVSSDEASKIYQKLMG